jgi:hypothetical protein
MGSSLMAEHHARVLIAQREREARRIAELALIEAPVPRAGEGRRIIAVWPMRAGLRKMRVLLARIRNIRAGVASCDFRPSSVPKKGQPWG